MKAELERLHAQVKKLPAREQEVIRLRYADGLNYKDLAAASNSSIEEVTGLLTAALNTLRGHKGKGDKSRYLAFVHGELTEADTEAMAELVEADPGARAEFESFLAISDSLTDLFDAIAEQSSKKKPVKKSGGSTLESLRNLAQSLSSGKTPAIGKPKLLIAGTLFAVAAAIVMFIFIDMKSGSDIAEEGNPPADSSPAMPGDTQGAPPDPAAPQISDEAAMAADAANSGAIPPADTPMTDAAPIEATAPPPLPAPEPSSPPAPEAPPKAAAKGKRVMMVDTAKTVIPKNINKKAALTFFGKKLNKVPSCIPTSDKKSKAIKAAIGVTKDGTYTQVNVLAPTKGKAVIAKCLKGKLGETAKSLRTTNKSGAKITLVLRVQ